MLRYRPNAPSHGSMPGSKTPAMEQTLILTQNLQKRRKSMIWGTINGLVCAILLFDISYKCPLYTTWFNFFEYVFCFVFSLNALYHLGRYFYYALNSENVSVTVAQKQLLGIKDDDSFYNLLADKQTSTPVLAPAPVATMEANVNTTPLNWSASSWRSTNSPNDSKNYSIPSPSWVYMRGSPEQQNTPLKTPQKLVVPDTSGVDFITNDKTLKQYLTDYEHYEKALNASNPAEQPSNLLSSFWSHPATQSANEVSPYLRRNQYQMSAQVSSSINSPTGKSDENRTLLNVSTIGSEIWRKLQVDPHTLIQWNSNLRMWISQTILERLVNEINSVNDEFGKLHLNDVRIGSVGLERLRKTAQTTTVVQFVPTITALLPFLELTPNQEYLVKRIKELAKGGCMSEFKWNSGGSYNGKDWEDSLVNDAEIIIHLLATYLDSQLLPLPNQPDAKPFSKEHFIRATEKLPQNPVSLAIQQVTEKPPHFRLVVGEECYDVAKGHNNLFYTVLLFLYFVSKKEHGMLGKVNMGRSGVNMLWILEGV